MIMGGGYPAGPRKASELGPVPEGFGPETDTAVYVIKLDPTASWAYSTFPHPLVTLDWDKNDNLIGIETVGTMVERIP